MDLNEFRKSFFDEFIFEKKNDKYPFLNIQRPIFIRQHYEVTDFSVYIIKTCYKTFNNNDNYDFIYTKSKRRQMSMPGAYLINNDESGIDIVADILTSYKYVQKEMRWKKEQLKKYEIVHHTIGNIIPIPEGANAGMPGVDYYYDKLNFIKEQVLKMSQNEDIINKEEKEYVERRIKDGISLGNIRKELYESYPPFKNGQTMRYWLSGEWLKNNGAFSWNQFIENYYLQDFVDSNYDLITVDSIEILISKIISRGYRIWTGGEELEPSIISDIYNGL